MARTATIERNTKETQISLELGIDGSGQRAIATPVPFLSHMLDAVARHGMFDLSVRAAGDVEIDAHHTVEDVGLALGSAFERALALSFSCPIAEYARRAWFGGVREEADGKNGVPTHALGRSSGGVAL